MGERVTTDQLSCVLATISYPLHSLKSSVTLATRDIMLYRPGASLSVIVAVLVSIIKQHFLINEFTAGISEYVYMYRAVFSHPLIVF